MSRSSLPHLIQESKGSLGTRKKISLSEYQFRVKVQCTVGSDEKFRIPSPTPVPAASV